MEHIEEREISIKELFLVIWNGKYLIGAAAFVLFIVALAGVFLYDVSNSQVATIVSLEWSGIEQGEYPDGSRFEYGEAIEPYILTMAVEELGYDLTPTDVRKAISFTPIVSNNVLSLVQTALENGEELTYFSSNYKFILDNGSLGLNVEEGALLTNEIVNQFRLDFEKKFVNQVSVLNITVADFSNYDYLDSYELLRAQKDAIDNAMESRVDSGYYSPTLGITFSDILVQTDLISRIELSQIATRTSAYMLTVDSDYLIANYQYKIEMATLSLDKATAKEVAAQNLVDNYTGSVNTILIPGLDTEGIEVDSYYNVLMGNLVDLQNEIADLSKDIDYYQLQIDRLDGSNTDYTYTAQEQEEEALVVESFITTAATKLQTLVTQSNILLTEYNDYANSSTIKTLMAPEYQSSVNKTLVSLSGLIIGAGLGAIFVLFRHDWDQY